MTRIRFGYLRLTVLLKREGWPVGKKLVYRLYRELKLQVRSKRRKKLASQQRGPIERAQQANQRWSMDFVSDRLEDGRRFRVLTIIDQYHRYSPALVPALSFSGARVVEELDRIARRGGYPRAITCDNGPEFCSRAFDQWAHLHRVGIDYIRPGKSTVSLKPADIIKFASNPEDKPGKYLHNITNPFSPTTNSVLPFTMRTLLIPTCSAPGSKPSIDTFVKSLQASAPTSNSN